MTRLQRSVFTIGLCTLALVAVGALGVGVYVYRGMTSAAAFQLDAEAAHRGFMAAGATTKSSQAALAKDPRFTELARAGDFGAIEREFGASQPRAQAAHAP
jgi:hypothetical protein